ncbi:PRTRC system ParB family protein (plasmid) [Azohydromonas lata]|uniref:PRTRC system ParB family protein n=1 Tax=Azohydromonas lata TaxID=45677 RepID=A0ABU5I7C7_9BURK|nr:PRTRC system ParB family protein [Azohydromonas lata]MDZ5454999.1 PRTRC system ParB family protein [Azohydromonas lata]
MSQPITLKHRQITPGPNPREHFDEAEMQELKKGIEAAGGEPLEPLMVRSHPEQEGMFQIIFGERRWRACGDLYGPDYEMLVLLREASDAEVAALATIENHHRANPSEVEHAQAAEKLLRFNKGDKQETALQMGMSPETLERRLLLLHCIPSVRQALTKRGIKLGHAELLAGLPPDRQEKVLTGILVHKVSVELLKSQLGQFARRLADAIFDTAQCSGCPHNSARQAALFDESIGDGFCQHPTHYEELTLAELEKRAGVLREQYPVVRIVKAGDGFEPLEVTAEGAVGVGDAQYGACKGCASFGCSISGVAGSLGKVQESLCFDAGCHTGKVAANRQALREAARASETSAAGGAQSGQPTAGKHGKGTNPARQSAQEPHDSATSSAAPSADSGDPAGTQARASTAPAPAPAPATSAQVSGRIQQFREEKWRAWVANRLMAADRENARVLAALALASNTGAINTGRYTEAVNKITRAKLGNTTLKATLEQCDALNDSDMHSVLKAVAASAAYGVDEGGLELLLNYLKVDEAQHFKLDATYLELLTMSELESLAEELKIKKAMGSEFKKARAGKKPDFIAALLKVKGFDYTGLVPKAMKYNRRSLKRAKDNTAAKARSASSSQPDDTRGPAAADAAAEAATNSAGEQVETAAAAEAA